MNDKKIILGANTLKTDWEQNWGQAPITMSGAMLPSIIIVTETNT
jgi:hypothetical protein